MAVMGDSKTTTYLNTNTWPGKAAMIEKLPVYDLSPDLTNITGGDDKIATVAANITAILAANGNKGNAGNFPYWLINLGTHDILTGSAPDHATWVANYETILDAIHAAHPTTPIYLMRDWVNTFDALSDTIDGWMDEVIAARSTFAHAGPDERVWFKPNVATYSADGVHYYTAAGQLGCYNAWKAALP